MMPQVNREMKQSNLGQTFVFLCTQSRALTASIANNHISKPRDELHQLPVAMLSLFSRLIKPRTTSNKRSYSNHTWEFAVATSDPSRNVVPDIQLHTKSWRLSSVGRQSLRNLQAPTTLGELRLKWLSAFWPT